MEAGSGSPRDAVRRLLTDAIRDPRSTTVLPATQMDLLVQLLRSVRLHGWLAARLQKEGLLQRLPEVAQQQLISALVLAESRARVAMWELDRVAWATRDQPDLVLICMKGCAYIFLDLPNAAGRIFADVDLLIPEKQLEFAESLLNRRGWQTKELSPHDDDYYRVWSHELPPITHRDRDVEIDLHHSILPRTARLKPPAELLVHNARSIPGSRYLVLAPEDLVLNAMVHLMVDSDLADKLRDLVDLDAMCRQFSGDELFWQKLTERAGVLGLERPLFYSIRYLRNLLGSDVPDYVLTAVGGWGPPVPFRWLMDVLVPEALFPAHPEHPSRWQSFARLLLYMRSHWLRMPPWLLAYHLTYKFFARRFGKTTDDEDSPVG